MKTESFKVYEFTYVNLYLPENQVKNTLYIHSIYLNFIVII